MKTRTLLDSGGVQVADVQCDGRQASWSDVEQVRGYVVVFVRRGCFRRRASGFESLLDPAVAYFGRPGDEQNVSHPVSGGDACTAVGLSDELLASLRGGWPALPERPTFTTPTTDMRHRALVSGLKRAHDPWEAAEAAIALVAALLEEHGDPAVEAGRPATKAGQDRIVRDARQALALDARISLVGLAHMVGASPHHLSRIFRRRTGETVSGYRNRLRVRRALERLAAGERNLSRLAADLGFTDHSHLVRTLRAEVHAPPSRLRSQLRDDLDVVK
ncbi:MAG: helix-turn-helix transcriptional regulator [Chloroflexi bacterium]|nr:MAG: helix-turn-helix transcriptional regulator [Chloroflexota bacterium]